MPGGKAVTPSFKSHLHARYQRYALLAAVPVEPLQKPRCPESLRHRIPDRNAAESLEIPCIIETIGGLRLIISHLVRGGSLRNIFIQIANLGNAV